MNDIAVLVQIVFAILLLVVTVYYLFVSKRKPARKTVLIVGPCGSGKTALLYHWSLKKRVQTVTSQTANRWGEIVDFPGHPKLRMGALNLIPQTRRIVYLVDGGCTKESLKLVAENVYDILTHKKLGKYTKMLICSSKSDLPNARTPQELENILNLEIETLRKSRAQELEGDNAGDHYIGVDDEIFNLRKHSPIDVEFGKCSVKNKELDVINEFIKPK